MLLGGGNRGTLPQKINNNHSGYKAVTLVLIQLFPFIPQLFCVIRKSADMEVGPHEVWDALLTPACIIPGNKTLSVSVELEGYYTKKGIRNTTLEL